MDSPTSILAFLLTATIGLALNIAAEAFLKPVAESLVKVWIRALTSGLSPTVRNEKLAEIRSELYEFAEDRQRADYPPKATGAYILLRLFCGVPSDIAWRWEQTGIPILCVACWHGSLVNVAAARHVYRRFRLEHWSQEAIVGDPYLARILALHSENRKLVDTAAFLIAGRNLPLQRRVRRVVIIVVGLPLHLIAYVVSARGYVTSAQVHWSRLKAKFKHITH